MQNYWHPQLGKQRNLDEIGMGATSKSMLLFHTPSVVKVVKIVGLYLITFICLQQMQNCWHPQLVEQRNLNLIGLVAARKSMLLFHTQTVVKVVMIVGLSLITLMCLQQMQNYLHPQLRGATKFEFDRNGFSNKKYITIPYFNCSESSNNSWFVSYYSHVPTINAKLLIPSAREETKFGRDRNGCSK